MREAVQQFFDATAESVGLARDFTTATLTAWGLTACVEDIRVCVSELASNALVHGTEPGYGFLVRLEAEEEFVRLEVHDSHNRWPRIRHPADTDTCGRGLLIVEALAEDWGVQEGDPLGKVVWSRLPAIPPDPDSLRTG
ncbi:ATP-binding protein [Planomonospora venezuelensis]|uniref:Anti-sigma regulatory factor (Ser/Thr protein kinase) n=1 Tax=Planomonospora venezuelensis TaxID=1999 RepID=A0A841D8J4_PLAVE|nr:ATP-binding protein [Planomonospora venezuelensis]MBB5964907.1 anti-sigma regulatory factor (Ser/Thr protein kinase) [Planomonospora venezuelensis]GIM99495.1 ATP-binding protein [Planomonospora venezuelensis]